ncbi:hypothetical protein DV515_00013644 [Chloebia gouldiae]|uniref:Uncharacterized protein n=1 Tax=Chloebia gouldiae TaxID=44316 RepID=A0A3L8S0S2_CHLGU|nr:hypothetical protein DV515_00013644 [Chloebia gouldiae]
MCLFSGNIGLATVYPSRVWIPDASGRELCPAGARPGELGPSRTRSVGISQTPMSHKSGLLSSGVYPKLMVVFAAFTGAFTGYPFFLKFLVSASDSVGTCIEGWVFEKGSWDRGVASEQRTPSSISWCQAQLPAQQWEDLLDWSSLPT